MKTIKTYLTFIKENLNLNGFMVSDDNILTSFNHGEYVYCKTDNRIYQTLGDISLNDEEGNDGVPTIMVDTNGEMCDFRNLLAENTYEVLEYPDKFSYVEYAKYLKQ